MRYRSCCNCEVVSEASPCCSFRGHRLRMHSRADGARRICRPAEDLVRRGTNAAASSRVPDGIRGSLCRRCDGHGAELVRRSAPSTARFPARHVLVVSAGPSRRSLDVTRVIPERNRRDHCHARPVPCMLQEGGVATRLKLQLGTALARSRTLAVPTNHLILVSLPSEIFAGCALSLDKLSITMSRP